MSDSYYPWFPGDYQRKTGDLSLLEHGAYRVMLDSYYSIESLPADRERLYRICRASSPEEKAAVDYVSTRFFSPEGDRLINNRAEEEINKRREFLKRQTEKAMLAVEARRRTREQTTDHSQKLPVGEPVGTPGGSPLPSPSPSPSPSLTPSPEIEESDKHSLVPETDRGPSERPKQKMANCPHKEIIGLYHQLLPECAQVVTWTEYLQGRLRARWREHPDLEWWKRYFEYVSRSDFLMGRVREFKVDLDWVIGPKNMAKIINGRYHQTSGQAGIDQWLQTSEVKCEQEEGSSSLFEGHEGAC